MKKSLYTALMLLMCLNLSAQTWNLKTLNSSDKALLEADTESWSHETGDKTDRYHLLSSLEKAPLTASGEVLDYAEGLLFTANEGSSNNGNVRIDVYNKRLWVAGSTRITIPNAIKGQTVTVVAKTSAGSSASDKARGVNVSANVTPTSGSFNQKSEDEVTNVGEVNEDGDIELSFTGAMYIYQVSLADDDSEDDGGNDTPVPSGDNDYSTSQNASVNQMVISLAKGSRYYNTSEINAVDIQDDAVTVSLDRGSYTFASPKGIAFEKAAQGQQGTIDNPEGRLVITEAKGWLESAYAKFLPYEGAKSYNAYVKGGRYSDYTKIDQQLVRNYTTYGRVDVLGLVAGNDYAIKIVPTDEQGEEITSAANEATAISVAAHNRQGFAHKGITEGIGAYNNDGSLKQNARVVYITKKTAKTVTLDVIVDNKGKTETMTGFQNIVYGYQKGYDSRPLAIRLIGTIDAEDVDEFMSSAEGIQIKGSSSYMPINITIEGVGDDATTRGFGFLIRNCGSVEMRNFANMLCMDDAISIDTDNEHIWIHHLDLFYGKTGSASDQAKGDGTIDLKGDSRYITISNNHLWDSGKASLCGMKKESGPNWITYHHNWFDHSDSRHPRIRTMSVHVWNNYFDGNSKYGVGAAYNSNAFVEKNYFRACKYPMLISLQGSDVATNPKGTFSGENGGIIKAFDNAITGALGYVTYQQDNTEFDAYEVTSRDETVPENVTAKQGARKYDNWDVDPSIMYDYTPDDAQSVPSVVTGWLGAGRMNHGDFKWSFDNADEDGNAEVIPELKNAITNYKSTLAGIFGDENAPGEEQPGQEPGNDNPGGDNPGDDTPGNDNPAVTTTILCSFDASGQPSNSMFTVSGNGSSSKGSITVDGVTYSTCLKMESSTSVKFTLSNAVTATFYFGENETASLKINDDKISATGNTYTQTLEAGNYELKKDKSVNLFLIKLVPVE